MKGARLHLDLFRVFRDLAQTKSFSKAADKNYLTQSAISQQLSFLEQHFGRKLVDRGKGHFALTEAGQNLLEGCEKILSAYQETVERASGGKEASGPVTVQTVYSIGIYHLALYVKTFMRRFPKVSLRVEYSRADRVYKDVLDGACDLGIVASPWNHPKIRVVPFQKEKLVLICAPDDPFFLKKTVRWAGLDGRDFIAFTKDVPTRHMEDELFRKHKLSVHIVQEFDNIETLKRSVEVGMGIALVPENTVAQEIKNRTLAAVGLEGGAIYRSTGIIHRKDRWLTGAAKAFIGWLTKAEDFRKLGGAARL